MSGGSGCPDEAQRVAAALVGCVLDGDTEGAAVLLAGSSHQVVARACTNLAWWITYLIGDGKAEFRTRLAAELQRATTGDGG